MEKSSFSEHIEMTAEEITNHFGFECQIFGRSIMVYSFIGRYEYKLSMYENGGHMAEFYRFCYCYAQKLQKYGIENKCLEIQMEMESKKKDILTKEEEK